MIDTVQYVVVPVTDVARSASFYCGVLGFEIVENEVRGENRWLSIGPPGQATTPGQATKLLLFPGGDARSPRRAPIFLTTADVEEAYRQLKDVGVPCDDPVRRNGKRALVTRDPDGNPLVLTEG